MDIVLVYLHGVVVIGRLERKLYGFTVNGIDSVFGVFKSCRLYDMEDFGAKNRRTIGGHQLHGDVPQVCRGKSIARQGADALVRHLQRCALWQIDRGARSRNASDREVKACPN